MTLFSSYYDKDKMLKKVSMDEIDELIKDEKNKEIIADYIFHRYYDRFLKVFSFSSSLNGGYDEFRKEFKHGFSIMVSCCVVIEAISSFFSGRNETAKKGDEAFNDVFDRAKKYNNPLQEFKQAQTFYKNIRCGLLHQGEVTKKFKIGREGKLFSKDDNKINAKLFHDHLVAFLNSYRNELQEAKWDSDVWDKCRIKVRHIIKNSR